MSILLFEDLLIVPLLAIVAFLSPVRIESSTPLWLDIGKALGSVAIIVAAGRWLLNPLFSVLVRSKAREVMTAAALLVVLGAGVLMEKGGLSMAMGAFLAGVMLSESHFRHQLEADVEPFRGLLLGLFFLAVGMSLDLTVVAQNWALIASSVVALMAGKAACIYAVARLAKSSHNEALERAMLMAQGGEFAFVLFADANAQGVISDANNANMTAIVVLSMVLTPLPLIVHSKLPKKAAATRPDDAIDEQRAVLQIGCGRFGQMVYFILDAAGFALTIIDKDEKLIAGMEKYGVKTYFGDGSRPELLLTAGIEKATVLVVRLITKQRRCRLCALPAKPIRISKSLPALTTAGIFLNCTARAQTKLSAKRLTRACARASGRWNFSACRATRQNARVKEVVQAMLNGEKDWDERV